MWGANLLVLEKKKKLRDGANMSNCCIKVMW